MRNKKKSFITLSMVGILTLATLGLTACGGADENQDSLTTTEESSNENSQHDLSVFDDFPAWWRDSFTEAELQIFLDVWTPEDLEEARQQAEAFGEDGSPQREGTQQIIVSPEQNDEDCDIWVMNENGLECAE